jgi:drug/metabolite transporter (DMT)-like permease
VALLILATLFWGLSFPVLKSLMLLQSRFWPGASDTLIVSGAVAPRFVFATILVLIPCLRQKPAITAREWRQGLVVGVFSAAGLIIQIDGLRYTAASTSAFLTQFYALTIPVWLALRRRRWPSATVLFASVLVLSGVALLGHFDWRQLHLGRGEWETLLSSTLFMGQILWLEHPAFAGTRGLPVTAVMFALASVVYVTLAVVNTPHLAVWAAPLTSLPWLGLTALLTVLSTVATYLIMNACQPKISSTQAALLYCFEPIFGSLLALCLPAVFSRWAGIDYPNERLSLNLLLGGGLITAANLLIQWKPPPRTEAALAAESH